MLVFMLLIAAFTAVLIAQSPREDELRTLYNKNAALLAEFDPQHTYVAATLSRAMAENYAFEAALASMAAQSYSLAWLHNVLTATPADARLASLYFRDGVLTINSIAANLRTIEQHHTYLSEIFYGVQIGAIRSIAGGYEYALTAERPK
jgi:hypothetical protein